MTPSPANSSHSPAWNRLIRKGPSAVSGVSCSARAFDQALECQQFRFFKGEVRAVGQQQMRMIPVQGDEEVCERDLMPLNGDGDAEVEPVGLPGHVASQTLICSESPPHGSQRASR